MRDGVGRDAVDTLIEVARDVFHHALGDVREELFALFLTHLANAPDGALPEAKALFGLVIALCFEASHFLVGDLVDHVFEGELVCLAALLHPTHDLAHDVVTLGVEAKHRRIIGPRHMRTKAREHDGLREELLEGSRGRLHVEADDTDIEATMSALAAPAFNPV